MKPEPSGRAKLQRSATVSSVVPRTNFYSLRGAGRSVAGASATSQGTRVTFATRNQRHHYDT
jgi:hypothetical protein